EILPTGHQLAQTDRMRGRYPGPSGISYSFGPGPLTPAIKAIMIANGLVFNMLTLYLMGVELERMWGPTFFAKFYFACGIGAGVTQLLLGLLPGSIGDQFYYTSTIGASGAIFG